MGTFSFASRKGVCSSSIHSVIGATVMRRSNFDAPAELLLGRVVIQAFAGVRR